MPSTAGQSILVIGGSSGIGAAVAKLASSRVIKSESGIPDAHVQGFTMDLSATDTEARLEKVLLDVTADGKLDHIVVTAGSTSRRSIAETDRDNLLELTQLYLVAPALTAERASSLVFCGGRGSRKPIKGSPAAAALSGGLEGLVHGLALDMAPLRVNVVNPGAAETELWGGMAEGRKQMPFAQLPLF
ncbi:hypothetical protein DL766_009086 [Monosporascus sp. MC13-8B]|uniref:Uncharacterized protein n=1 Tax=Monosporascus cannonballus TaxID=155416 RepID=A0ABY0GW96_9PEZI|nr:hypothetical protein DL763_010958 [Monosporascus cannonballus]RYO76280.1 hypothetical protein DL762_009827 [Monosporascus cannonballus]RYP16561.1 hypothetical protein DL766_009086 [Monosporascus sp. MC13-8B]